MIEQNIYPQEGFQMSALSTSADIAILGGAAGSGKSFVLLMESLRHIYTLGFGAVIFRRTMPQIRNEGALWDTSMKIYPIAGGKPKETILQWDFPNGNKVKFSHLQYDNNVLDWQGSQIAFIGFDELTHFSESQFWYMLSRNRSVCGVKPYCRATCNPDPESWVARLIEWYINQDTGFPIPERAGVLRYFIRLSNEIVWGLSIDEVLDQVKNVEAFKIQAAEAEKLNINAGELVKSFTFIPGSIYENAKLLSIDPAYLGNLMALPEDEQQRLLYGNWKISFDSSILMDWVAVQNIFSNYPSTSNKKYITIDASRFGRDFTVLFFWIGWTVRYIVIMRKSEALDIVREAEILRAKFQVKRTDVLVDQDGVGGGTVKLGKYRGFSGGAAPYGSREVRRENYQNLKTQCAYMASERVNNGEILIDIHNENCLYIDEAGTRIYTTKIKIGSNIKDVRDLIKDDLRSYKAKPRSIEGKLQIEDKEEQKIILGGRSPDFGDNILLRQALDIMPQPKFVSM